MIGMIPAIVLALLLPITGASEENSGRTLSSEDAQRVIWRLREQGEQEVSRRLERELVRSLQSLRVLSRAKVGIGVDVYERVRLENGIDAVWKPGLDSAAYALDRELGLDWVPVAVLRSIHGTPGTLMLDIETSPAHRALFDYLMGGGIAQRPKAGRGLASVATSTSDRFDEAIRNSLDRVRAARTEVSRTEEELVRANLKGNRQAEELLTRKLKYLKKEYEAERARGVRELEPYMFNREVYEKLKATSKARWAEVLGPFLDDQRIVQVVRQRDLLVRAVESARQVLGDDVFSKGPRAKELK